MENRLRMVSSCIRKVQCGKKQTEPADDTGAEFSDSDEDEHHEPEFVNIGGCDSDSLNSDYQPSEEKDDSINDLHFTDSEDELDPDISGFEDVNVMVDKYRAAKKKGVANENFEDDEGADNEDIPCAHAVSCINFKRLNMEAFVADCYKKEAYLKCYESVIHQLNGPDLWETT
ncbi:hypothetical protein Ahy_B07g088095 [Arachis hypogaea]|uniref:Uncharacterized protein n=1 Tax=Arachis hypogaea TaxID=3818 RepID=A0A444YDR6_ARAHY|nr:hypothetical protein Ahy_B07g088095 [Arachis hypogaea]